MCKKKCFTFGAGSRPLARRLSPLSVESLLAPSLTVMVVHAIKVSHFLREILYITSSPLAESDAVCILFLVLVPPWDFSRYQV